jgi:hypothetical protein
LGAALAFHPKIAIGADEVARLVSLAQLACRVAMDAVHHAPALQLKEGFEPRSLSE